MSKNFGTRKAFKGHFISEKELNELSKEYASNMLHALALNHPVKLVTLEHVEEVPEKGEMILKETGATFFTVASPKFVGISKFTTTPVLRQFVLDQCRAVVSKILEIWPKDHPGSIIYLLSESQLSLTTTKDNKIEAYIALHLAGAKKESAYAPSTEPEAPLDDHVDPDGSDEGSGPTVALGELGIPLTLEITKSDLVPLPESPEGSRSLA